MLLRHLNANEVRATRLPVTTHEDLEADWRRVYQTAFMPGGKFLRDAKADYAYLSEPCTSWLVVPFLSNVPGTAIRVHQLSMSAFECHGRLLSLEQFAGIEFSIFPPDLSWTFVRTHEDYALGGPYFTRHDWRERF